MTSTSSSASSACVATTEKPVFVPTTFTHSVNRFGVKEISFKSTCTATLLDTELKTVLDGAKPKDKEDKELKTTVQDKDTVEDPKPKDKVEDTKPKDKKEKVPGWQVDVHPSTHKDLIPVLMSHGFQLWDPLPNHIQRWCLPKDSEIPHMATAIGGAFVVVASGSSDKVLVVKTKALKKYTFAGGTQNKKELPRHTAVRELLQEVGVAVDPKQLQLIGMLMRPDVNRIGANDYSSFWFVTVADEPKITMQEEELLSVAWIPLADSAVDDISVRLVLKHLLSRPTTTLCVSLPGFSELYKPVKDQDPSKTMELHLFPFTWERHVKNVTSKDDAKVPVEKSAKKDEDKQQMQVVYNLKQPTKKGRPSIYLAGPSPRSNTVKSWRPEAIALLKKLGFTYDVIVPECDGPFELYTKDE